MKKTKFTEWIEKTKGMEYGCLEDLLEDMILSYINPLMDEKEDLTDEEADELIDFVEWGKHEIKNMLFDQITRL